MVDARSGRTAHASNWQGQGSRSRSRSRERELSTVDSCLHTALHYHHVDGVQCRLRILSKSRSMVLYVRPLLYKFSLPTFRKSAAPRHPLQIRYVAQRKLFVCLPPAMFVLNWENSQLRDNRLHGRAGITGSPDHRITRSPYHQITRSAAYHWPRQTIIPSTTATSVMAISRVRRTRFAGLAQVAGHRPPLYAGGEV